MKKISSYEIALSGISSALATVCLILSYYLNIATVGFWALASVMLMLPLFGGSLRGCVLAYVVSSFLGFIFTGYIAVMPYVMIFGIYTILFYVLKKYVKRWYFALPIKLVFVNVMFFATISAIGIGLSDFPIFQKLGITAQYLWLYLAVSVLFAVYDYCYNALYLQLGDRLKKILAKYKK